MHAENKFDLSEIAKIRTFLMQASAEPGFTNYQQLGITSLYNVDWLEVPGLYWDLDTIHVDRILWSDKKLGGHLDFSGITNLRFLHVGYNNLKSVNVRHCSALQSIDLYTNDLYEIDVTTNPELNYLRFGFNNIQTIDLSNNLKLGSICCTANRVSSLDVSNKPMLQSIKCLSNNMHTLKIDNCPNLESIACDLNSLTGLNLNNLTNLKTVSCVLNELEYLHLDNCVSLEEIHCQNNKISSLDASSCVNLSTLICKDNKIETINLSGCNQLVTLTCENNFLTSLDVSNSPLLSKLSCQNNYLSFLTLPLPNERLVPASSYSFVPQRYIALDRQYNDVDLSDFYKIQDIITKYEWYYKNSLTYPLEDNEGRFVFKESYIGEIFICRAKNNTFPGLTMHYDVTIMQDVGNGILQQGADNPVVYAGEHTIHITTSASSTVRIFSLLGALLMNYTISAGQTSIPIERGMYLVVVNDNTNFKVFVR